MNHRTVLRWNGNNWESVFWKSVRPGDVLKVLRGETFPSDLLCLTSTLDDGVCYVETVQLDGETNTKVKRAMATTLHLTDDDLRTWSPRIECELPNKSIYTFTGNLITVEPPKPSRSRSSSRETRGSRSYSKDVIDVTIDAEEAEKKSDDGKVPILPSSILLRGASLRNTDYIIGVAIFTGHQTKIMMNASRSPSKRSTVEKKLDKVILFMFFLLFTLCTVGAVFTSQWTKMLGPDQWYLDPDNAPEQFDPKKYQMVGVTSFFTSFILYGYLIPISLYISVEFVKIIQAFVFINLDRKMYCAETDTPAAARTSNLNEELGMVHTVLSDKTGTLTRNVMEFFKCTIGGIAYGSGRTEIEVMVAERSGIFYTDDAPEIDPEDDVKGFNLHDARLNNMRWLTLPQRDKIGSFFRILSLCHTVIPETVDGNINYQAESPDEEAFVIAAAQMGFRLVRRTCTSVFIEVRTKGRKSADERTIPSVLKGKLKQNTTSADGDGDVGTPNVDTNGSPLTKANAADNGLKLEEYEILNIIEFNSFRKRMSVVYRDPSGRIFLACKGADTVIYERLRKMDDDEKKVCETTSGHLEQFGASGLRTLCIAQREIGHDEYDAWQDRYVAAANSMVNRQEKLDAVGEEIERDLELIGASAIEDKLQDKVPNTIQQLRHAGIRIWVLTGDKLETAINIGYACSLLDDDMTQYTVCVDAHEEMVKFEEERRLAEADAVASEYVRNSLRVVLKKMERPKPADDVVEYALCITGKSLKYALKGSENIDLFTQVTERCKSVICCRVSPSQKAEVTTLVKNQGRVTLGIGDGANDVGMIQAAHIGVGISGQEGMQAVMASDFSIAQFKFLERLLLVHGRWNYLRITKMVAYFFYKNILFGMTLFYYNAFAFFSGQIVYNAWSMTFYNVIFTVFPVLVIGTFDQDVSVSKALLFPRLYEAGIENKYFTFATCAWWMLDGVWQSIVLFSIVFFANFLSAAEDGRPVELWNCGTVLYTSVIVAVHLRLAISLQYWTRIHHIIIWGSVGAWFFYLVVYGAMDPDISNEVSGLFIHVTAPTYRSWFVGLVLAPVAAVLPALYMKALNRQHNKADHEIIQEVDSFGGYIEGRLVMYGRKSPNARKGRWSRRRSSIALGGANKKYSGYSGGGADIVRPEENDSGSELEHHDGAPAELRSYGTEREAPPKLAKSFSRDYSPALQKLDDAMKQNPHRHKAKRSAEKRTSVFGRFSKSRSIGKDLATEASEKPASSSPSSPEPSVQETDAIEAAADENGAGESTVLPPKPRDTNQ